MKTINMNRTCRKKKSYKSQSKPLSLQSLGRLLALSLSRLGIWEAASLRHLHAACFSSFVGVEVMILFNPWQQRGEGAIVFFVTNSKHGATKDCSCSQVNASVATTVTTNTATIVKNDTNRVFILTQCFILVIHYCVFLILDGWNTEGDVTFIATWY